MPINPPTPIQYNGTLSYGGVVLPCSVERFPDIHKAKRKFRQYNIPGRNGDLFFQSDAWENVIQSYQVFAGLHGASNGVHYAWDTLAPLLYLKGYQRLEDSYDDQHYRLAVFNGGIDIENSWNEIGRATLEFNCRPERYLTSVSEISVPSQASFYEYRKMSEMSSWIQDFLSQTQAGNVVVVSIPSGGADRRLHFNFVNDGEFKKFVQITPGTEATAEGGSQWTTKVDTVTVHGSAWDFVIPAYYFDGLPEPTLDGVPIGSPMTIYNPYMPALPNIRLHNTRAHTHEAVALQINGSGVHITGDADFPYYYVDTENWIFTKDTEELPLGSYGRWKAPNVRVDPGLKLIPGDNNVFGSGYYETTIEPRFWEI